jgi:hypothetical protein
MSFAMRRKERRTSIYQLTTYYNVNDVMITI